MAETSDWEKVRLSEVITIKHGWPFKTEFISEELTGRPIVVNIGNFRYTGGFRFDTTRVREYRGDYPPDYELQPGDILVVMTCQTSEGEILGVPARVPDDGRVYLHNQRLGKVVVTRPDKVLSDFLYWLFLWREFNRWLFTSSSGTKILHTAPDRIGSFEMDLPSVNEQHGIASILSALDNKVELNERLNMILEEIAKALFKRWFIDFEFPNEEGKPYKSSGGDMVYNKELGKELPKGWSVVALHDVCEFAYGEPLREDSRRIGSIPVYGSNGQVGWHDKPLVKGPGIVVGRKGNPGVLTWAQSDFFPIDTTFYVVPKGQTNDLHYLFHAFSRLNLPSLASDSAVPGLNRNIAYTTPLFMPPAELLGRFEEFMSALTSKVYRNNRESSALALIRELVLPRLMSGKIRVPVEVR
jgi:type I restriction enzyme S subunit